MDTCCHHSPYLACLQLPGLGAQHALIDRNEAWPGTHQVFTWAEDMPRSIWCKSCVGWNVAAGMQGGGRSLAESRVSQTCSRVDALGQSLLFFVSSECIFQSSVGIGWSGFPSQEDYHWMSNFLLFVLIKVLGLSNDGLYDVIWKNRKKKTCLFFLYTYLHRFSTQ